MVPMSARPLSDARELDDHAAKGNRLRRASAVPTAPNPAVTCRKTADLLVISEIAFRGADRRINQFILPST